MKVLVYKDAQTVAQAAAMVFAAEIMGREQTVIGLATGATPLPTYKELVRLYDEGLVDFSGVTSFNLDEYIGLDPDHPCSYRRYMDENLFSHINIPRARAIVPDGVSPDPAAFDRMIADAGGIDLQLLGIGSNGHIGFNEPADEFVYPSNIVPLTENTIRDNARFFDSIDDVPKTAISMGIGTILSARRIVLIATGAGKADAIAAAVNGPIRPQMPASILRTHHDCLLLLDKDAASKL
ncbi:MAG: glucosamine-6-phosphate deaminase [Christensenellales bacterium]|jgi:glucosamine-6-phosphate deaminase